MASLRAPGTTAKWHAGEPQKKFTRGVETNKITGRKKKGALNKQQKLPCTTVSKKQLNDKPEWMNLHKVRDHYF